MSVQLDQLTGMIDRINSFNATPGRGITRLTFTPQYEAARRYLVEEMEALGLTVYVDDIGNLFGTLEGSDPNLPAVMAGSHIDTVNHGGRYDGVVGTVAAVESARRMIREGIKPRNPFIVAVFAEEEGSRFGQVMAGSRALTGLLDRQTLYALTDSDGTPYSEALDSADLKNINRCPSPANIKCMLEAHIEQSVVLEQRSKVLGIVQSIAGIQQATVTIEGTANHAGATPMAMRSDALAAAAEMITAIEDVGSRRAGPSTVATVGNIDCEPNVSNVISGLCRFSVDVRDSDAEILTDAVSEIRSLCTDIGERRGVEVTFTEKPRTEPVTLSRPIGQIFEESARKRNLPYMWMPSGAVHDAAVMAQVTEVGMLFVPSRKGRSHVPEEFTAEQDILAGVEVFSDAVISLCGGS